MPVLFIGDFLYNTFLFGIFRITRSSDFRSVVSARVPSQHDRRPQSKYGNIELFNVELTLENIQMYLFFRDEPLRGRS